MIQQWLQKMVVKVPWFPIILFCTLLWLMWEKPLVQTPLAKNLTSLAKNCAKANGEFVVELVQTPFEDGIKATCVYKVTVRRPQV